MRFVLIIIAIYVLYESYFYIEMERKDETLKHQIRDWVRADSERSTWIEGLEKNTPTNLDETLVTFIIPSRGRSSLTMALASLLNQDDPRWRALVILNHNGLIGSSGHSTSREDLLTTSIRKEKLSILLHDDSIIQDPRITVRQMTSSGGAHGNVAGAMRNAAFEFVDPEISPWVAFLDDDDVLTLNYVSSLAHETEHHPNMDAVIFPMRCNEYCFEPIVPVPGTTVLKVNYVGISFALRSDLVNSESSSIRFIPGTCEDYTFFSGLVETGLHARFAPNVTYVCVFECVFSMTTTPTQCFSSFF